MVLMLALIFHIASSVIAIGAALAVSAGIIRDKRSALVALVLSLLSGLIMYVGKWVMPETTALLHITLYVLVVLALLYGKEVFLFICSRKELSL